MTFTKYTGSVKTSEGSHRAFCQRSLFLAGVDLREIVAIRQLQKWVLVA